MLERWTRTVVHFRIAVLLMWTVVVVLGLFAGARLPGLLTTSLAVPGTGSATANAILSAHFGQNVEGTFTVVVPFNTATSSQITQLEKRLARAAGAVPSARVIEEKAYGGVLYANVGTSMSLVRASDQTAVLRHALHHDGLAGALVTGPPALNHDIAPVLARDLHRGELLAVFLSLLLLLGVLGLCWALLVPFLVASATTAAAVGVVFLLAHHFLMVLYIPNVIELIGLGLAIDYSLLILHRYRGEVNAGASRDEAIVRTMATAGRTIFISGCTVAIGLATLLLVPVPFVRSLGAAGLVVPLVALAAALTLQPALLSLLGRRGVAPIGIRGLFAGRNLELSLRVRVTRRVLRSPLKVMLSSLVLLALFAVSIVWLQLTPGSVVAVPQQLESARALTLVSQRVGPGLITPNEIVLDLGTNHLANTTALAADRFHLATSMLHDPEVFAVAIDATSPFVSANGRFEQIFVLGRSEFGAEPSQQLVRDLRDKYIAMSHFPSTTSIYLGGAPAQGVDFLAAVYGAFPWIVLLAFVVASLVLARAFRSVLLALVAVLLDLVSVAVSYGLLVVFFRFGVGSALLGTYHVSQIEGWVPVFLFAMLFGLSMDYEVFIVARIREAYDQGASTNDAIASGLANTAGVVTAAALVMVGALSGLVFGHVAGLQELGVGLSLGVVIDATIVRGLLLPSVMGLLGRWNWWLPRWLAVTVRTNASPLMH